MVLIGAEPRPSYERPPLSKEYLRGELPLENALTRDPAARSMLGKDETYEEISWFWSDRYEHYLQYTGFHTDWDELVVRGTMEERNFVAFYRNDRWVLAAVAINRGRNLRCWTGPIKAQVPVEAAMLRDPDVDPRTLVGDAGASVGPAAMQ